VYLLKGKQSHYRPWQALRVPENWGSQILRQLAHEGGKVVSHVHRLPLPQEIFLVLIPVRGWVDPRAIVWPEGLCEWKNPVTPSGIEPETFQFVAQCLNHCEPIYVFVTVHNSSFPGSIWVWLEISAWKDVLKCHCDYSGCFLPTDTGSSCHIAGHMTLSPVHRSVV
jgi:hypothetical protein